MKKDTDVHHITVAGVNPHNVAVEIQQEGTPFHDHNSSVAQHIIVNGQIVGGIVETWTAEHLTAEQEKYLHEHPHVIDVRHVWPE